VNQVSQDHNAPKPARKMKSKYSVNLQKQDSVEVNNIINGLLDEKNSSSKKSGSQKNSQILEDSQERQSKSPLLTHGMDDQAE
jgi:hypothetical protein